jgi:pimeloyl-ACP methyl ester carboxylesterase
MQTNFPKTIVLIHGAFVTNKTWENWIPYFEQRGYNVLSPAWPYKNLPVSELKKRQPDEQVASTTLLQLVEYYSSIIAELPEKPIVIGHSLGGLLVQLLMQKNLVRAGVAIHSVPPQGITTFAFSFFRSTFKPLGFFTSTKKSHLMSLSEWKYAFTNGMTAEQQKATYESYAVPESKLVIRAGLTAAAKVDFKRPHTPLLFIAGSDDHIMPASLNYSNYEAYENDNSVTDYKEFLGRNHFVLGLPTWREEADYIYQWINKH